jgi:hypothetical protein
MVIDPRKKPSEHCAENLCNTKCDCGIKFDGSTLIAVPDGYKMDFSNLFIASENIFYKNIVIPKTSQLDISRYLDPNIKFCVMVSSDSVPGSDHCGCHDSKSATWPVLFFDAPIGPLGCTIPLTYNIKTHFVKNLDTFTLGCRILNNTNDLIYEYEDIVEPLIPGDTSTYEFKFAEFITILNSYVEFSYIVIIDNLTNEYQTTQSVKILGAMYHEDTIGFISALSNDIITTNQINFTTVLYKKITPLIMTSDIETSLVIINPNETDAMLSILIAA